MKAQLCLRRDKFSHSVNMNTEVKLTRGIFDEYNNFLGKAFTPQNPQN